MSIEVDLSGGKYHWLSPVGRRPANDAIHQKHRARYIASIKVKPVSDATREKGRAIDEGIAEAAAYGRHRARHRISRSEIEARHEGMAEAQDYGRHRAGQRIPLAASAERTAEWVHKNVIVITIEPADEPAPELPVEHQLLAWSKGVIILDASEVMIRDLIETRLAGIDATVKVRNAAVVQRMIDRLMREITAIRSEAVKTAFRAVREQIGDRPILDASLARWAAAFLRDDLRNIAQAIQTGIVEGLDNMEIARRIVGSLALNGVDGVTQYTRFKLAHLGRAGIKESNLRKKESESPLTPLPIHG